MAPPSLASWFEANPGAAKWVLGPGAKLSGAKVVAHLRAEHAFPFRDRVAINQWRTRDQEARKPRHKPPPERFFRTERDARALERHQDFFVTCAVESAPVCAGALRALELAAEECGGKVLINPIRYRSPTSGPMHFADTRGDSPQSWDSAVRPYLLENELRPHPLVSIMTTKAAATAANPLPARVSSRTQDRSAVFGHPQLAMRTVATPQHRLPKILYSSGAITERAYSDTLAGDQADFHHSVAAVKVEIRGKRFHLRELTWDGGRFIDLDRQYTERGISKAPPPSALVLGDIHVGLGDAEVDRAIFGEGGIVSALKPRRVFLHDTFDGRAVNHHERHNRLLRAARATNSVAAELADVAAFLERAAGVFPEVNVVASNHDEFLDRWLRAGDYEHLDAKLHHWLSWKVLDEYDRTGAFPMALETALRHLHKVPRNVRFVGATESYQIDGIEYAMHGHRGPNGARGSIRNLSQIGCKSVVGHNHSPGIFQGVYQSGVGPTRLSHGYNDGAPSGWLHTQVAGHANGMRQMIHVIGDKWRG